MFHDIEQNSDEWLDLRKGHLTGSNISKVMANYGKAFGEPAKKLAVDIAIEQITGKRIDNNYTNGDIERGHEQEPMARQLYESTYFCKVDNGGFFDNGFTGCSPDGLVGNKGVIEIKSVIPSVQYKTIKRGLPDPAYKWQIAFNLMETGREWIDYVSYCADFPEGKQLFVHRLTADDLLEQHEQIYARVREFTDLFLEVKGDIENV